jgi:hypothetical protein
MFLIFAKFLSFYSAEISSFELLFGSHKNKKSNLDITFHNQAFVPNHQTSYRDQAQPRRALQIIMYETISLAGLPSPIVTFF